MTRVNTENTAREFLEVPDTLPEWMQVFMNDALIQRAMDNPDETIPFTLR